MTLTTKSLVALLITSVLFAAAVLFSSYAPLVGAAVTAFGNSACYTAAATSTQSYMTAGAATTTVTCTLGSDGADSANLNIIVNASSTASIYDFYPEESMDGQDWYPIAAPQVASTSPIFTVTTRGTLSLIFASSTIGAKAAGLSLNSFGVSGTNNRNHYTASIPVRMKMVRVHAAIGPGALSGGVWMQIIPKAQL